MTTPSPLASLGDMRVTQFLRQYWQRKPLLLRGVFPGFAPPVGRARLFELAALDTVESRLVQQAGRRWSLRHGPFARSALPPLQRPGWTLLVQGLDGADDGAHALLERFRFVSDARLDDLMASYASAGGGVGPHVDQYDVFLLQAQGRRRWRISAQRDLPARAGLPLRQVRGFRATREWVLEPGDMLYLPPGIAHEGTALGECITYSIGFRAPSWAELHDPWLADFAEHETLPGRYADPGLRATRRPAALPPAMLDRVHAALSRARPKRHDTQRFLLRHLSEPKAQVVFDRPHALAPAAFARAARSRGVALDRRTRMLTDGAVIGINGEVVSAPRETRAALHRLANRRRLEPAALARAPRMLLAQLHEWQLAGWLQLGPLE